MVAGDTAQVDMGRLDQIVITDQLVVKDSLHRRSLSLCDLQLA